jgi:hypothetical protein
MVAPDPRPRPLKPAPERRAPACPVKEAPICGASAVSRPVVHSASVRRGTPHGPNPGAERVRWQVRVRKRRATGSDPRVRLPDSGAERVLWQVHVRKRRATAWTDTSTCQTPGRSRYFGRPTYATAARQGRPVRPPAKLRGGAGTVAGPRTQTARDSVDRYVHLPDSGAERVLWQVRVRNGARQRRPVRPPAKFRGGAGTLAGRRTRMMSVVAGWVSRHRVDQPPW